MSQLASTDLTVSEQDVGTPEASWLASPRLRSVPEVRLADLANLADLARSSARPRALHGAPRVVVLAPHPDDEVLAVGGILATLARAGWPIEVIAVTDGEGSHPRSRTVTRRELVELRDHERARAFEALGIPEAQLTLTRLGCPDSAVRSVGDLPERIAARLGHDRGASVCLAPWARDGHPDHDAVGKAARRACEEAGVPLLEYPVWAWHWARPGSDDLPWARARSFVLDEDTRAAKRRAIAAYRSQMEPLGPGEGDEAILPLAVQARFHRPFEILFS